MKSHLIIYALIISIAYKVNAYDDSNGLIQILSQNKTSGGLSMYEGNSKHTNYFIILNNHGIENNADFKFSISWSSDKEHCHNEDNWPKKKFIE